MNIWEKHSTEFKGACFKLLLTTVLLINHSHSQDFLITQENDTLYGNIKIAYKIFDRVNNPIEVGIRSRDKRLTTFTACQLKEVKKRRKHYIIRSYQSLERDCYPYPVILDGTVKLFDCELEVDWEIYAVELPDGQFFPITEKIYYKWLLPYYLQNPSFKMWYEELNVYFPNRKKDVLGAKGQPKVNRFIYKMTQKYNEFVL